MPSTTQTTSTTSHTHDEHILVVKCHHLFPKERWNGLKRDNMNHYLHCITRHQEFHPRSIMETDFRYKQIIPYLVFKHTNRYFLMERDANASEQRLKSKLTLGIGGHIRKEDMQTDSIFDWARREFYEEINYAGSFSITPLGILNDDSNDVGKVHIGFVFLLEGDSDAISIKSELQSGRLAIKSECVALKDRMESWSQFVVDQLF